MTTILLYLDVKYFLVFFDFYHIISAGGTMVDYYVHAKRIVEKKISKEDSFYPFFVCAIYGLLCKYKGNGMLIAKLFKEADIIFEEGSLPEILKRNQIEIDMLNPIDEDDHLVARAASNQGHFITTAEDGSIQYKKGKPFIACSLTPRNDTQLLQAFCHEMGHLIKGERNSFFEEDKDDSYVYTIRSGLTHNIYIYKHDYSQVTIYSAFPALDEAVNCFQTTDVMREILALGDFVTDENVKQFIDSLDKERMKQVEGYQELVELVRPLWNNDYYRGLVERDIVDGNIDAIIDHYDEVAGEGKFEDMAYLLDDIYQTLRDGDDDKRAKLSATFQKLGQSFLKKATEKELLK